MSINEIAFEFQQRISATEEKVKQSEKLIAKHEIILEDLGVQVRDAVLEIKQIRNALYFMAAAIASNVPIVGDLASKIVTVLGFK